MKIFFIPYQYIIGSEMNYDNIHNLIKIHQWNEAVFIFIFNVIY